MTAGPRGGASGVLPDELGHNPDVDDVHRLRLIIDFIQHPDAAGMQAVDACAPHATALSGYG